jgi:three-Cys-motif partner protein
MQLHLVGIMWKCLNCGTTHAERPTFCNVCGLVQAGIGTREKYQILESYCRPLSLIMRNQGITHYFIDACAGSGKIQSYDNDAFLDGSPLIMAKTREWVQGKIRDKDKPKEANCIFIEISPRTFKLLEESTCGAPNCERILGDCNYALPKILDRLDSERFSPFAFIYVDPFGLGDPPIMMETLRRVLERHYTELFIQLSVDGLIRVSGWLPNLKSEDSTLREKAESYCKTLGLFIGNDRMQEFCKEWEKWREGEKEAKALQYYISGLTSYFPHVEYVGIPVGSARPVYYLVYTTRNETGKKIMQNVIAKTKRKGMEPLEKWM